MSDCTRTCVSIPIAWFVLEQYRLGDLDDQTKTETEQHLKRCPACAEAFAYIERDQIALPPLPLKGKRKSRRLFPASRRATAVFLAAAASLLMALGLLFSNTKPIDDSPISTKGGTPALSLVRMRGDTTFRNPTHFEEGDRFRLYVTSPAEHDEWPVEVVVYQAGQAYFPFPSGLRVPSGNEKGLDGAFTLTGEAGASVCVIIGDDIPSRETLNFGDLDALPPGSVCVPLLPVQ